MESSTVSAFSKRTELSVPNPASLDEWPPRLVCGLHLLFLSCLPAVSQRHSPPPPFLTTLFSPLPRCSSSSGAAVEARGEGNS